MIRYLMSFFLLLSIPALATERFVDQTITSLTCTNYSMTNRECSGGTATAYKTAQAALNAANVGDTIVLRAGIYAEVEGNNIGLFLNFPSPTSEGQRVTIRNYVGEVATIAPPNPCGIGDFYSIYATLKSYVTIDGLNGRTTPGGIVIDGANCDTGSGTNKSAIVFAGAGGGNENNFIRVQGVEIKNVQSVGVYIEGNDAYVGRNLFHDATGAFPEIWSQAVYIRGQYGGSSGGDRATIEYNEVYNYNVNMGAWVPTYTFVTCPSGGSCGNATIKNNLIHDVFSCIGIYGGGSNTKIFNNICYNTWGHAIRQYNYRSGDLFSSNTIYNTNRSTPINAHLDTPQNRVGIMLQGNSSQVKNSILDMVVGSAVDNTGSGNAISNNFCNTGFSATCGTSAQISNNSPFK